jgi:hypothetical protein
MVYLDYPRNTNSDLETGHRCEHRRKKYFLIGMLWFSQVQEIHMGNYYASYACSMRIMRIG